MAMKTLYDNKIDDAFVSAMSEYSSLFPVSNVKNRQTSKRWRSYRAPNLMLHGNCDSDDAPTLDGTPYAAANGTWARDELLKYEGVSSWKLTKTTAPGGGYASAYLQDSVGTTDMHGLSTGVRYDLILQMRTDASIATHASFQVQAYIGGVWTSILTLSGSQLNAWHLKKNHFTIPTAATGIMLHLLMDTNAAAGVSTWIDKIIFFESNGKIKYGECEMADAPTLDSGTTVSNCAFARSAFPYTGTYSWKINKSTAAGAGTAFCYFQSDINTTNMHGLEAGKTYYFDLYAYTSVVTPGNALIRVAAYVGGSWTTIKTWTHTVSATWQHFYGTVTIPSTATGIEFYGRIDTAEAVNTAIWVDVMKCSPESRITIDLYDADAPQYAAVIGHNLSSNADVYVQANTTDSWTSPAISESVTWDEFLMLREMTNTTNYRYWSVVLYDNDYGEDGYQEIGVLFLGDADSYNGIIPDFDERVNDTGTTLEGDSGEVYGTDGVQLLEWPVVIPDVYVATKTQLKAMIDAVKLHTGFIWIPDEDQLAYMPARYVRFLEYSFPHVGGYQLWEFHTTLKETR